MFDPKSLPYPPNDAQAKSYQIIDKGNHLSAILATGKGKTNIGLYACQKAIDKGKRFLFCSPLKALCSEQNATCKQYWPNILPVMGDFRENREKIQGDYVGYNMTYESAYQYMIQPEKRDSLFQHIGCVVIDEAHMLGNEKRGPIVENLIYFIQTQYPAIQIILLSATIGNREEFAAHFNTIPVIDLNRAVEIRLQIAPIKNMYIDKESSFEAIKAFIESIKDEIHVRKPSVLIFCGRRNEAKELSEWWNGISRLPADYHNSDRTREEREQIEDKFRKREIFMLFCTTTLSMGLNTPCDISIITFIKRKDPCFCDYTFIEDFEVMQMIGRAGRQGSDPVYYIRQKDKTKIPYALGYVLCDVQDVERAELMTLDRKSVV